MNTDVANERELKADVDRLRASYPKTQDLYREVCALMFFRYGIAPTANKLYQLVRKGSMGAPAEALTRFWEDLREKSRVRIEHPDLPEELKTAAAEMTMALWSSAQSLAQESLDMLKQDAQAAVAEAKALKVKAESDRDATFQSLEQSRQAHNDALQRISELERLLASSNATVTLLESQLQQAREDQIGREEKLEIARREFASELDKISESVKASESRYLAAEKRALLEIDRERSQTSKLQRELVAARASLDKISERHRAEVADLQQQIGELRQNVGIFEGTLQNLTARNLKLEQDQDSSLAQIAGLREKLLKSESESKQWEKQAHEYLQRLSDLQKTTKPKRVKKMSNPS